MEIRALECCLAHKCYNFHLLVNWGGKLLIKASMEREIKDRVGFFLEVQNCWGEFSALGSGRGGWGREVTQVTGDSPGWLRQQSSVRSCWTRALKADRDRKGPSDLFVPSASLCLSLFPSKQQFNFVLFYFLFSPFPVLPVLLSKGSPGSQGWTWHTQRGWSSVSAQLSRINCWINISNDFLIQPAAWQGSREQDFPAEICLLLLMHSYKLFIFKTAPWKEQCFC